MDQLLLRKARRRLLRMHYESNCGHIGSNLSCLDIIMTLYHDVMKPEDVFILSKGHSAGALYIVLWSKGILDDSDLQTFHSEGTQLSGHPPCNRFPDIPFSTGSLGHGVSLACGLALAKKIRGESGRVYVLTSDGEMQEGSTLEGFNFLIKHNLPLTCIVDNNGLQGFGTTKEIAGSYRPFSGRVCDILTTDVDGHDCDSIAEQIRQYMRFDDSNGPLMIIANTTKGQGVSFMENRMDSHYLPMNAEQYEKALMENPE